MQREMCGGLGYRELFPRDHLQQLPVDLFFFFFNCLEGREKKSSEIRGKHFSHKHVNTLRTCQSSSSPEDKGILYPDDTLKVWIRGAKQK